MQKKEIIRLFMDWASVTRREGLLALESKVEEIDDPFLRNGMRMIIDGNDQDFVRDVLVEDIHSTEERHRAGALIFSQAGMYAPTLGVLGAVVGLVAALANLSDMDALAHSISAAFIATLLGIFTGYVLWHPFANKLKRLSKNENEIKLMMVEGLLSIQSGVSTIAINQKFAVFLTPTERAEESKREAAAGWRKRLITMNTKSIRTRHGSSHTPICSLCCLPFSLFYSHLVQLMLRNLRLCPIVQRCL